MKYAVIDGRMSEKCRKSLENLSLSLIDISENVNLDKPISGHPDISVFSLNNTIITEIEAYPVILEHLFSKDEKDIELKIGYSFSEETKYPYDCVLNFAVCGNYLIGNMKYINPYVAELSNYYNMKRIDVKQGYAKCNICVVDNYAIITEDKGIANACRKNGIDVLLLETHAVNLNGYDNGFIGGATGLLIDDFEANKVLFCGSVERHPEYGAIKNFCESHGAVPVSLSDEDLYDYGSIIIL